jgi:hypothetical protein
MMRLTSVMLTSVMLTVVMLTVVMLTSAMLTVVMLTPVILTPVVLPLVLPTLVLPAHAAAQPADGAPDDAPSHDKFALGVTVTPAITGSGPWLIPALRVTTPLAGRFGLDVESGAIFEPGRIDTYLGAQLRIARKPAAERAAMY